MRAVVDLRDGVRGVPRGRAVRDGDPRFGDVDELWGPRRRGPLPPLVRWGPRRGQRALRAVHHVQHQHRLCEHQPHETHDRRGTLQRARGPFRPAGERRPERRMLGPGPHPPTGPPQQKVPTDPIADSHLVSDSNGRLYLLIETYSFSPSFRYVINYTWSDDGINWSLPTPITSATTWALNGAIAVDASNHVHVAWEDFRTVYSLGVPTVWYMQSTDRGLTWSLQLPLETTAISNNPQYVHLATFGSNVMAVWGSTGAGNGMTYAVSGDGGATWYDAKNAAIGYAVVQPSVSGDENGTFWTVVTDNTGTYRRVGGLAWNSPPTTPANVAVARSGTTGLSVSWSRDPEKDVAAYRVWRSSDGGRSYQLLATLGSAATSYLDSGLVNGTYWYGVTALDLAGTSSHPSFPLSGTVGPTTAEMIAALQAQITALKAQLSDAQANITALQNQLVALQNQLTALQNAQAANDTATRAALANLQGQISSLWNQLNQTRQDLANARAEQATQTMSYVNMALAIIIVLLVAMLLLQMRRPRNPVQVMSPEPPGRVVAQPRTPEEEL